MLKDWSCHLNQFASKVDSLPISNMGMPLGGNPKYSSFWFPIIEKIGQMEEISLIER